ncbi:tRNA pseudouridine(55) synthase TruB [Corynebacterium pseudotuberculosis]|uniref:tRNA pseudouridine(55) synthase TruB n=1 Tax=Corynebacterium pseudotuberculosis TaxID=1719 RepID=UPI00090BF5F0|nr:tRNA pseudouridine(55) synthase TruB [Corynebacterium pseudotuberculosis]AFM07612.2 tRNA pseudouridine(55) synthase TruB [Corynebacterium pseudotuberculosis Cp162]APG81837.1 tRNA pseudouridine synthase B [Corynebacterium pseudotuberculosis]WFP66430.1 tRNA pseudouridine(55) synthase TruB [Corynebacterium pseudotuberculosis]
MIDPLSTSGLVVVDKPAGMTSHDVVGRLRRIFGTKRVGHAGTLDPMATGVLVVGIERGTKFLAHMVASTKSYRATIRLGLATTTDDKEGEVVFSADASTLSAITDADIAAEITNFTGNIMQRPASVSAIKINGKRAHQMVREGQEVEIPPRPVTIYNFDVLDISRSLPLEFIDIEVEVTCSSGTYIRSLARDLGSALNVGGHLTALRRLSVGPFSLSDTITLDDLTATPKLSLSLDESLTRCYPTLEITESEATDLSMGKWLQPRGLTETHAAVAPNGQAIALIKEKGKRLSSIFVARPNTLS